MCRITIYVVLSLIFLFGSASAQVPDLPVLASVDLSAKVSVGPESDVLVFEYQIDNTEGTLPVIELLVPLDSDASRAAVTIDGLDNSAGATSEIVRNLMGLSSSDHVLVAYPNAPVSWLTGSDATRSARWGAAAEGAVLQIGQTLAGFVMLTRALPGIREARLAPDILDLLPSEDELDALDLVPSDLREETRAGEQIVKTVAPVGPPAQLDLAAFVGEIAGFHATALEEDWIRDPSVATQLSGFLDQLQVALAAEDFSAARLAALELVNQVESQSCADFDCPLSVPLTAEARALLAINGRFVLAQIPNSPPECGAAVASPAKLWPPNRKFSTVSIVGVTDADDDPLTVAIISVTQDEPADNDCPTAVINGESVDLWSERLGDGNGRIYSVSFIASDPAGAECTGEVEICVPHDQGDGSCARDSLVVDSTICP